MGRDSEIAPQVETGDYAAGWMALRWYQTIHFVVMFGGALIAVLLLLGNRVDPLALIIGWLAVSTVAGYPLDNFPCPRCGDYYFKQGMTFGYYRNAFTRYCMNCGLPKWHDQD